MTRNSLRDMSLCQNPELYKKSATIAVVKVIENKLSQGAKSSHGGILPVIKLTENNACIRRVPMGEDVVSPLSQSS